MKVSLDQKNAQDVQSIVDSSGDSQDKVANMFLSTSFSHYRSAMERGNGDILKLWQEAMDELIKIVSEYCAKEEMEGAFSYANRIKNLRNGDYSPLNEEDFLFTVWDALGLSHDDDSNRVLSWLYDYISILYAVKVKSRKT